MIPTATDFAAALAATGLPWERQITTAVLPGTDVRIKVVDGGWLCQAAIDPDWSNCEGRAMLGRGTTAPEAISALSKRLIAIRADIDAIRADIDAALNALAPAIPTPPAARPVCPLCNTDADAPTVERLILTPATVHAACSAVSDHTPEPGEAIDRLPDFVADYLPDAPEGSLRHTTALAALSRDYPGILTIAAALKATQPTK